MDRFEKATIYFRGGLGNVVALECRSVEIELISWAQYSQAVKITYVKKGARKPRSFVQSYAPSLVVVAGHGRTQPPSPWKAAVQTAPGVSVQAAKHSGCSPEWQNDFDAELAQADETILADFRGHDAA